MSEQCDLAHTRYMNTRHAGRIICEKCGELLMLVNAIEVPFDNSKCPADCIRCLGEFCDRHSMDGCDCDVLDRHRTGVRAPQDLANALRALEDSWAPNDGVERRAIQSGESLLYDAADALEQKCVTPTPASPTAVKPTGRVTIDPDERKHSACDHELIVIQVLQPNNRPMNAHYCHTCKLAYTLRLVKKRDLARCVIVPYDEA